MVKVLDILSLCKAVEGSVAVATLTDTNAADDEIDSAFTINYKRSVH